MSDWNPSLYLKFAEERTQPSIDLAGRIPLCSPSRVLDVGCGPGNSTAVLASRYPNAKIIGIDNSPNMLEEAAKSYPHIEWQLCDASTGLSDLGEGFDVIFSNAVLQWVPDHAKVLGDMIKMLASGGVLATQIPNIYNQPISKAVMALTCSDQWKGLLGGARTHSTLSSGEYYDILSGYDGEVQLWETTYMHVMDSCDDILQWYRSTGLRPYLNLLSAQQGVEFEAQLMEMLVRDYPIQKNGKVLFPFPRLFFMFVKG